jgi:hypothetical protein
VTTDDKRQRIGAGVEASQEKGTHTPPATPPATSDLQMVRIWWPGALTPSRASLASSARLTMVVTAVSPLLLPTTSSDAISPAGAAQEEVGGGRRVGPGFWRRWRREGVGARSCVRVRCGGATRGRRVNKKQLLGRAFGHGRD